MKGRAGRSGGAAAPASGGKAAGPVVPAVPFVAEKPDGTVRISVHAVPRASRTEAAGLQGASLKIRVQAPPEDGRANDAICKWAAAALGVPRRDVELAAGFSSREKVLVARFPGGAGAAAAALWPDFGKAPAAG